MTLLKRAAVPMCIAWIAASVTVDAARFNRADAVVVGEITAGQHSGRAALFRLRIDRVLHGIGVPGITIEVESASRASRTDRLAGMKGIWMLQAGQNGRWKALPPMQTNGAFFANSFYPAADHKDVEALLAILPNRSDPGDLIAAEMAASAESASKNLLMFKSIVVGLLFQVPRTPATLAIFRKLNLSSNPRVASLGLAGLVMQNDDDALERVESSVSMVVQAGMLREVGEAVRMRIDTSPRNVAALGRLATGANIPEQLQFEAAWALQRIHSREAIPYLIRLLDSAHAGVRQFALSGLSLFAENLGVMTQDSIPTMAWLKPVGPTPYRTRETDKFVGYRGRIPSTVHHEYVAFWKSWWAKYGNEISVAGR